MVEDSVNSILELLKQPGADAAALLHSGGMHTFPELWQGEPALFRAFGQKLISTGHPVQAFELIREGLAFHPHDLELKFLRALALARGGNISKTEQYIEELLGQNHLPGGLDVELLSLAGRLKKDAHERVRETASKNRLAAESAELYEKAYALSHDYFPGINAATMCKVAGRDEKASRLAAEVVEAASAELPTASEVDRFWVCATLGEAHVIKGDVSQAMHWYGKALRQARDRLGDVASMRRNLMLLANHCRESVAPVLELLNLGCIAVFAGHMIDSPGRQSSGLAARFPPNADLEAAVAGAIEKALEKLNVTVGYSSAACGSDILFAEKMLERGGELHITLPFDREDFYRTSVDFGLPEMADWRRRCDRVLKQATEVHYATRENYLDDVVLFEFVNTFTQGLALTHASRLRVDCVALVVLDSDSARGAGGTAFFLKSWQKAGRKAHGIDLAKVRSKAGVAASARQGIPAGQPAARTEERHRREIKVMLFADVKNFSQLRDKEAPLFFARFLNKVSSLIDAARGKLAFWNTWGDGLFLVFHDAADCADFAMKMLAWVEQVDWENIGLPADLTVRIAIHTGPVFPMMDSIIDRRNYFGTNVTRAARIEPVTMPGCAFTSEQFAAALMAGAQHDFACEYIGIQELAKGFGRCALYKLERR